MLTAIVLIAVHPGAADPPSQQVPNTSETAAPQQSEDARFHWLGDSWAQWLMAGFALAATVVSLRGLYLLRRTFEETANTAKEAAEANKNSLRALKAERRPWIEIGRPGFTRFEVTEHNVIAGVYVSRKNVGNSPAINVQMTFQLSPSSAMRGRGTVEFLREYVDLQLEHPSRFPRTIFPGSPPDNIEDVVSYQIDSLNDGSGLLILRLSIKYQHEGFDEVHQSAGIWLLSLRKDGDPPNVFHKIDFTPSIRQPHPIDFNDMGVSTYAD